MYMCTCIYIYIYIYVYTYAYIDICAYIYVYIYIYIHRYIDVRIACSIHIYTRTYMYTVSVHRGAGPDPKMRASADGFRLCDAKRESMQGHEIPQKGMGGNSMPTLSADGARGLRV